MYHTIKYKMKIIDKSLEEVGMKYWHPEGKKAASMKYW